MSLSTFTAISEIFVTIAVLYIVIDNYRAKAFHWKIAVFVMFFEFLVNMLYMIFKLNEHTSPEPGGTAVSGMMIAFYASHGILSLVAFILFVVFSCLALVEYKKGKFFFQERPKITYFFIFLWLLSVISGEAIFLTNLLS